VNQSIPVLKKLEEKFANRVIFVGLHTPGTEMSQVKKLLELKEWKALVGMDKGTDAADGETAKQYHVRGYPTVFVIDKQGRIAFTTDASDRDKFMERIKSLTEELNIPWQIDKDVSEDETIARLLRINELMFTKEIETALAAQ
jgi:hypothetical protein